MAISQAHPEREICLEVAGRITASAIESGKLSSEAEAVSSYLSDMYFRILKIQDDMNKRLSR